jgi:hypothetical protein
MLLFLWIIPIAVVAVGFVRMLDGKAALKDNERRLFFDETKNAEFGIWLGVKLGLLAAVFFIAALIQGILLPNLSGLWLVTGPLLTGSVAIVLLGLLLRRPASRRSPRFRESMSRMQTTAARIAENLFR